MSLNLTKTVLEYLQAHSDEKFTAREIAEWIFETYPAECSEKRQRSRATVLPIDSEASLKGQIAAEIGSQRPAMEKRYAQLKTTEGRPRKYYFSLKSEETEIADTESGRKISGDTFSGYTEHDLYSLLSEFLWRDSFIYSKRINEKRASNIHGSGGNRWLFPDLIGFEDLSREWDTEIKQCVNQISDRKTKLWSKSLLIDQMSVMHIFRR